MDRREDFVLFAHEPERAIAKLRDCGIRANTLVGPRDKPIFNRSLAYQTAGLYPPPQAEAIRRLVQTVFATPFCWREDAIGRYGKSLRELLLEPPGTFVEHIEIEAQVGVEAHVEIPLSLPDIETNFPEVIQRVRESKAGRDLRQSVRGLGQEADFRSQIECWNAVAEELASAAQTASKPVSVSATAIKIGYKTILGAVIKGLYETSQSSYSSVTDLLPGGVTGAVGGIAFDHGLEVLRRDLRKQRIRGDLERAVEFRCNWIQMPH